MSGIKKNLQVIGACFVVLAFCAVGFFLFDRKKQIRLTKLASVTILKIMGVRVVSTSAIPKNQSGRLIVANHVSVIDVLVLSLLSPVAFITSVETRETPFFGWIAKKAGCLFVERRSRHRIKKDLAELRAVLAQGIDVVLFAEGTSSNGDSILPFKKGLFKILETSAAPVLPVVIQYQSLGGQKITPDNRDRVFYYGDHELTAHLGKIFSNPEVVVQAIILPEQRYEAGNTLPEFVESVGSLMRGVYQGPANEFLEGSKADLNTGLQ